MAELDLKTELQRFEAGDIDPGTFYHRDHIRMAFAMLRTRSFAEAAYRFSVALQNMAARAGRPQAYHETVTLAFLALVSEHLALRPADDFAEFEAASPALFDKTILRHWYAAEQLASPVARRTFVLPPPALSLRAV